MKFTVRSTSAQPRSQKAWIEFKVEIKCDVEFRQALNMTLRDLLFASAQVFDAAAQLFRLIHLPRQICLICSPLRRAPDIQLPLKRTWPGWPRQHYLHTWETSVWCWPPARLLHLLSHHALCKLSLAEPESAGGRAGRRAEPRRVGGESSNCLLKMPTEQDEAVWRIRPDWPRSSAACRLISGDRDTHKHAHALTTHTQRTTLKTILHSPITTTLI